MKFRLTRKWFDFKFRYKNHFIQILGRVFAKRQ